MDKFKSILHKMEVVIENDEGISMSVFKALRYGLKAAIKERDELNACEGEKQPDTASKCNKQNVSFSEERAEVCDCPLTFRKYPDKWSNKERCSRCGKVF